MAFNSRYSTVQKGAVTVTGNTLGLSGNLLNPPPLPNGVPAGPAAVDTIGAFISTNNALKAPGGWPDGTTIDWTQNSSSAILNIPAGSTVLYAELIWSGISVNADQNVTAFLDNEIDFTTPNGNSFKIKPDPNTASEISAGSSGNTAYVRSQNVTSYVQAGMGGTYTVGNVPGALGNSINNTNVTPQNFLVWSLEVVYYNPSMPVKSMSVWVNDTLINASSPPLDIDVTGFATPSSGSLNGKLFIVAVEGDANIVGDQAFFGPDEDNLTVLGNPVTTQNPNPGTPPNNPINNFFGAQINGEDCKLDKTGTFGDNNQNAFEGTNTIAARQGLDIACVDLSNPLLQYSQTSAVVRLATVGDAYGNIGGAIQINGIEPMFSPIKTVNTAVAQVGDTLTYTVTFTNTGSGPASNLVFTDILPTGTTFVPSSVIINNTPAPTEDPNNGIAIGTVAVDQTITIVYQADITSTPPTPPTPPQLINDSVINYEFEPIAGTILTGSNTSTEAITTVVDINSSLTKSADKTVAQVGDEITYTLTATNTGDTLLDIAIITDTLPANTTLKPNSTYIDGILIPGVNIETGISLAPMNLNQVRIISFTVIIGPNAQPGDVISNFAFLNYGNATYGIVENTSSNIVNTTIIDVSLNLEKSVDKAIVQIGDEITYTLTATNTGNTILDIATITDTLPVNTTLKPNSTYIDSILSPGANIEAGISLASMNPNQVRTIEFTVIVGPNAQPGDIIPNFASASYGNTTYGITENTTSNIVNTTIVDVNLSLQKSVDKTVAQVGDEITYTLTATNIGNTILDIATITDTLPTNTTLKPNSTYIDGILSPGANIEAGISLAPMNPNQVKTIEFTVIVGPNAQPGDIIPNFASASYGNTTYDITENTTSNIVNTTIVDVNLSLQKSVDKAVAQIGDEVTYTLIATNIGDMLLDIATITDTLPVNTTLKPNSTYIDGILSPGANIEAGISLAPMNPNQVKTIEFTVIVGPNAQPGDIIPNFASASYGNTTYDITENTTSNIVNTTIVDVNLSLQKSVDKAVAQISDEVTYTLTATNIGDTLLDIATITDTIPVNTTLKPNSTYIDGVLSPGANIEAGISLAPMNPDQSKTIKFTVIIGPNAKPGDIIPNFASASYGNTTSGITGNITSNTVNTTIVDVNLSLQKSVDKTVAQVGDEITYTLTATNIGNTILDVATITDTLPVNTTLKPNSTYINGVLTPGANIEAGISLAPMNPNQIKSISFTIIVGPNAKPGDIIPNFASASYGSTVDGVVIRENTTSNIVETTIVNIVLTLEKELNKTVVQIGDEITYILKAVNNGSTILDTAIITDALPINTTLKPNSTYIDGVLAPGANIVSGISVAPIVQDQVKTISFTVIVGPNAKPGDIIPNFASASYGSTVDGVVITDNTISNTVETVVENISLLLEKSLDKTVAQIGDEITYTITATNNGSTILDTAVVTDIIPVNTTLKPNSTYIDGILTPGANIVSGIDLAPMNPNQVRTISFTVIVGPNAKPSDIIPNFASASYGSTVNGVVIRENTTSNIVETIITNVSLLLEKSVDKTVAQIGDEIIYTITATNNGSTILDTAVVTDNIPINTTLKPNSIFVDGVLSPGANIEAGISLAPMNPSQVRTISFTVIVGPNAQSGDIIPNFTSANYGSTVNGVVIRENTTSNIVNTTIVAVNLNLEKSLDKVVAQIGDEITYTLTATNTGTVALDIAKVTDILPPNTALKPNSIYINGVLVPGANIEAGIDLAPINPNQVKIITFTVIIGIGANVGDIISNFATANYGSTIDGIIENTNSNTVNTTIIDVNLVLEKSVDKTVAQSGDEITYTLTATNAGSTILDTAVVKDIIPVNTTLKPNSTYVNGVLSPGANIEAGIELSPMNSNQVKTISFIVIVGPNVKPGDIIPNFATSTYGSTVDGVVITENTNSNTVNTNIVNVSLVLEKSVDKTIVQIDDEITYTVLATNNGNTILDTAIVKDIIPTNTILKPNSTYINGTLVPGANIEAGIELAPINPNQVKSISFTVIVGSGAASGYVIPNFATSTYGSTINGIVITENTTSNTVNSTVVDVDLEIVKSVDLTQVVANGILTYTLNVTNIGGVSLDPVMIKDAIPVGTTLIPNTTTVDNVLIPGANISLGLNIAPLGIGVSKIIKFQVKVDKTLLAGTVITNVSNAEYSYIVGDEKITETTESNKVTSVVEDANLTIKKEANKEGALIGNKITYTLIIENSGNLPAFDVIVKDILSSDVKFDNNVKLNGNAIGGNIVAGINIGTVPSNSSVTLSFDVVVISVPSDKTINNISSATYSYAIPGQEPIVIKNVESNEEQVKVYSPKIEMTKHSNKEKVEVDDTFIYTINIRNTGDIMIENFILKDILPPEFTVAEIKVDNNVVNGIISIGIPIGNIAVGQMVIVEVKVLVNSLLPNDTIFKNVATGIGEVTVNPNSPKEKIEVSAQDPIGIKTVDAKLRIEKSSNVDVAVVGDIITYAIKVTNIGNINLDSVVVSDPLSPDLDFIENSVEVNTVPMPQANILANVEIGPLSIGQTKIITFKAKVIDKTSNKIINVSIANFTYILNPGESPQGKTQYSNENIINVFKPNLKVEKTADKKEATLGDIITFAIVLTNDSDVKLTDIIFKDDLPTSLQIVDGTFTVDGKVINGVDLKAGVNIGSLNSGKSIVIKYQAKVIGGSCSGIIRNNAFAEYRFILPNGTTGKGISESSSVDILSKISIFKQITIDKNCMIPCQKPPIEELDTTHIDVEINNSYVIKTLKAIANEGQNLSGYKLIVHGLLRIVIEYTADVREQSVHSAHYEIPFSSFIILPPDYKLGDKVEVSVIIENVDTIAIGAKELFMNAALLLIANISQ